MDIPEIVKNKKILIPLILCITAIVFAIWFAVYAGTAYYTLRGIDTKIADAFQTIKPDQQLVAEYLKRDNDKIGELKQKRTFTLPPAQAKPPQNIMGILGNRALIDNKWYSEGDSIGSGKVLSVNYREIVIEWNGSNITLSPLGKMPEGIQPANPAPTVNTAEDPNKPKSPQTAEVQDSEKNIEAQAQQEIDQIKNSKTKKKIRAYWSTLSTEKKKQLREKLKSMSRQERKKYMNEYIKNTQKRSK